MKTIKKIVNSVARSSAEKRPVFTINESGAPEIFVHSQNYALRIIDALRAAGYNCNFKTAYYSDHTITIIY